MKAIITFLLFVFLLPVRSLHATPILREQAGPVSLTLEQKNNARTPRMNLRIKGEEFQKVSAFSLSNPPRLVIDLFSKNGVTRNREFKVSAPPVDGIRIGAHSDKTRIVLDLSGDKAPQYSLMEGPGLVVLGFSSTGTPTAVRTLQRTAQKPAEKKTLPTSTQAQRDTVTLIGANRLGTRPQKTDPQETTKKVKTKDAVMPTAETPATGITPKFADDSEDTLALVGARRIGEQEEARANVSLDSLIENTPATQPLKSKEDTEHTVASLTGRGEEFLPHATHQISNISFQEDAEESPSILLHLEKVPQFVVRKRDDRSYSILIEDCSVSGTHLLYPYFPPQDFKGLTMINIDQEDNGLSITVGVERGYKITARARQDGISIMPIYKKSLG